MAVRLRALVLALALALAAARRPHPPPYDWEKDFAGWRNRTPIDIHAWWANIPSPQPAAPDAVFHAQTPEHRHNDFIQCLNGQIEDLTAHVATYQSPKLDQVGIATRAALAEQKKTVTVAVFWGRERFVSILWKYLERNLVANGGIVDKIILVTSSLHQDEDGRLGAQDIADAAMKRYPQHVSQVPMCKSRFGCAFDSILTDNSTVYIKVDDDIVFIKDGSFEHMVLQLLKNDDYAFYTASIVNNPHSFALHKLVGAYPPFSYHWRNASPVRPPYVPANETGDFYYGKNMFDSAGSLAHEAFVYNIAHNRLDAYTLDVWNMNQCRCGLPQIGMDMCMEGYYRWNVNVFAYLRERAVLTGRPTPKIDEPEISMHWPLKIAPHRIGFVGESLFVHLQYTQQRNGDKPGRLGLRQQILLPWYSELARQYTAGAWGSWQGNVTLHSLYEDIAWSFGE